MEQADRYNKGKLRWSLVNFKAIEEMVKVLEFGAEKYDDDNWKKGLPYKEVCESAMRHLLAFMEGHTLDEETHLTHTAHVMANMMFLQFYMDQEMDQFDNRVHKISNWRNVDIHSIKKAKTLEELKIYDRNTQYEADRLVEMMKLIKEREKEFAVVRMEDSPMTDEIVEALECGAKCKGYEDVHQMMHELNQKRSSYFPCPHVVIDSEEDYPDTTDGLTSCKIN
jgi:hypothetical protein